MNSPTPTHAAPGPLHAGILRAMLILVAVGYCLQVPSPLRVNNDAETFLTMALSARDGQGFTYRGEPTHFPPGYPAAVALLDAAGLGRTPPLILLNLIAITFGLLAWWRLQRQTFDLRPVPALAPCLAALLAWPMLKHATLPVSEPLYIGLSLGALHLLQTARNHPRSIRLARLAGGALLILLAICTRTVGVALLPALAVALLPMHILRTTRFWQLCAAGGLGLIMLGAFASRTLYGAEMIEQFRNTQLLNQFAGKLMDSGELVTNLPSAKLPHQLDLWLRLAGLALPVFTLCGLWRHRRLDPATAYLLTYGAIMIIWPYHDPRFWVPVLPLLFTYTALGLRPMLSRPIPRRLALTYAAGFVLAGALALAHITFITYSGPDFPERYAGGALRPTYQAAFGQPPGPQPTDDVNPNLLMLLRHFDRHARAAPRHP